MVELTLTGVFLAGLLGGPHCAGMCGGVVSALARGSGNASPGAVMLLAYNAGRIGAYVTAGAIVGGIGSGGLFVRGSPAFAQFLFAAASLVLVVIGLRLAGIARVDGVLERGGAVLWRSIAPVARAFVPVRSLPGAVAAGFVWGWLPCGMVYTAALAALVSGSAGSGALIMAAFGLATLPAMLGIGFCAGRVAARLQKGSVRIAAGLIVVAFGVYGLASLAFPSAVGSAICLP
jgi:sulfite exporter TauE/SafE